MTEQRSELIQLVESLPEDKVEQALQLVRSMSEAPSRERKTEPFGWIGSGSATNGRTDNATHVDEILAQGFGR